MDELISDVLLWTPAYGQTKAGRPARTYIQQLCENTGCRPGDLPEAMNDREKWRHDDDDTIRIHMHSTEYKFIYRRTLSFQVLTVYYKFLDFSSSTRGERQNSYYANPIPTRGASCDV